MYRDASAIARVLYDKFGTKAIAEAAQKALSFERAGDKSQAQLWRRVESVLLEMRGPRES